MSKHYKNEVKEKAVGAKAHLIKHKMSVIEVRCGVSDYPINEKIFTETLGEDLIGRVKFFVY